MKLDNSLSKLNEVNTPVLTIFEAKLSELSKIKAGNKLFNKDGGLLKRENEQLTWK